MKKLKLALVGTGEIAQNYHLPALKNISNMEIAAVCDLNKSLAGAIAEKYNIPACVSSVDELLSEVDFDAVDICTSTDAHADLAGRFIKAGKHTFVERPLARSLQETRIIRDLSKEHNVEVMVGMNQRFRADAVMIKNYINQGQIGDIFYIKAGWLQHKRHRKWIDQADKSGGGVLMDLGLVIIDSLLWFYDFLPVRSVQASVFNHHTKNVEDVCVGSLRFENGSIATFESSWTLFSKKSHFYCDIYGSKGSLTINPLQLYKGSQGDFSPVPGTFLKNDFSILKKSFETELRHFVNSALGIIPSISSADDAVKRMRIVEALYRSAKEGREIEIKY